MRNKGLIIVFAVLFGLVSIYQLSYTFIANKVEKDAKSYAERVVGTGDVEQRQLVENQYLDSIANNPVIFGVDYKTAKDKELNKGLDLKGGINVILEISVHDILKTLSNDSRDPAFNEALQKAAALAKEEQQNFTEAFFREFNALPGDNKLASPDIFFNKNMEDDIRLDMTNQQVRVVLEGKIDEAIASAFEVFRKRIDRFGVVQPNVQRLGESARILVELPGAKDIERITSLLQSTAQLEFWEVFKLDEMEGFLIQANDKVREMLAVETKRTTPQEEVVEEETEVTSEDSLSELLGVEEEGEQASFDKNNPIFSKIVAPGYQGGAVLATFSVKDTAEISSYLKTPQVRRLLPAQHRFAKFVWGLPNENVATNDTYVSLYALQGNRENKPALDGSVVVDASQSFDQMSRVTVDMQMNGRGAREWEALTGKAYNNQSQIAIVLDDVVYSAPGVTSGPIAGGRSQITGDFSISEGQDLANILKAGKLPASADIVQAEVVGPTLGQEAINSGIMSFTLALALVLIWVAFYYGRAGLYADVALMINLLFIFGILASLNAVLTLPGIAGIVLTIGMAVDANVLIFERIREELRNGKTLDEAVKDGFQNALSSILDANITTALTGLVLFWLGSGPIKGFATTLLIGIATSLFTAIFITRLFVAYAVIKRKKLTFSTAATANLFNNVNINFLGKRKMAYILSGALMLISIISMGVRGFNQGVDFVGGRTYTVRFDEAINTTDLQEDLMEVFGSAEAKTYGARNQVKITTNYLVNETGTDVDEQIEEMLFAGLKPYLPSGMTYDQFTEYSDDKKVGRMEYYKVSPTIADDIKTSSAQAVGGALLIIFLYILMRFRGMQFSFGAVGALAHNVIIVLGVFSLFYSISPFSMEIDQSFIAAILTVIGYTLNDTVVVFDRIREYFGFENDWSLERTVNDALNSTLSRTLNTSMTTFIVLLAMFLFGAESIRSLIFGLMVGVVVGTYSSLFIATPLMFDALIRSKNKDALLAKFKKKEDIDLEDDYLNI